MAVKIMVVDDAAFMRIMLKELLKAGGYEFVLEAANGSEAVQMYKSYKPEVVKYTLYSYLEETKSTSARSEKDE